MNLLKKFLLMFAFASVVCSQGVTADPDGKSGSCCKKKVVANTLCVKGDAKIGGDLYVEGKIFNTTKKVLVNGAKNFYYAAGNRFDKFNVNDRVMYVADPNAGDIVVMDPVKGTVLERIKTLAGAVDDLDIGPDTGLDTMGITRGTIYYTPPTKNGLGRIHPDGTQDVILQGSVRFINAISFSADGSRLFVSQCFNIPTNGLFEVLNFDDPNPLTPSLSTIVANLDTFGGGLNGFCTGHDGFIYGPLTYSGKCVKINPDFPFTVTTINASDAFGNEITFYGTSHADLDSSQTKLIVSDFFGTLYRINDLASLPNVPNTDIIGQGFTNIDSLFLDSSDKIYFTGAALGDVAYLKTPPMPGCKRTVSQSGIGSPFGLALLDNEIFVAELFNISVYQKTTGDLKKHIIQPDWLPNPESFNFSTFIAPTSLAPMNNQKLLVGTFNPTGRIGILDLQCNEMLSLILLGSLLVVDAIALDDNNVYVCGVDATSGLAAVRHVVLDDSYQPVSITPVPVTGLILPVSLAKSQDGTKVWVSDWAGGQIKEIFSNTVLASGLGLPMGIAEDIESNNVLFLEQLTSSLKSIDITSGEISLVEDQLGALNLTPPNFVPWGVTSRVVVDPMSGILYVTVTGDRQLLEIRRG